MLTFGPKKCNVNYKGRYARTALSYAKMNKLYNVIVAINDKKNIVL